MLEMIAKTLTKKTFKKTLLNFHNIYVWPLFYAGIDIQN